MIIDLVGHLVNGLVTSRYEPRWELAHAARGAGAVKYDAGRGFGPGGGGGTDLGNSLGMPQPVGAALPGRGKACDDRLAEPGFHFTVADPPSR